MAALPSTHCRAAARDSRRSGALHHATDRLPLPLSHNTLTDETNPFVLDKLFIAALPKTCGERASNGRCRFPRAAVAAANERRRPPSGRKRRIAVRVPA